ncbi:MAG: ADP-ribosylglycohydrolase family protein [Proteobacteria bacterium]|nr:ADP-ribosylglycohydrolase family protein [Pseudomonadota bacterium]NBX86168.1 ADP-ribosylglycohydrolase family protein [Pseudomonadota bacterium]
MHYRFPLGPLTAMAIGDAAGAGFEFQPAEPYDVLKQRQSLYIQHKMYPFMPAGCYTDDTQRAITLVQAYTPSISPGQFGEDVATRLVEAYQLDPRGYGKGMFTNLQRWTTMGKGERLRYRNNFAGLFSEETKRESAGAVMAASILGVPHQRIDDIRRLARAQASITHKGNAVLAAEVVATLANYLCKGMDRRDTRNYLAQEFGNERLLDTTPIQAPKNLAWDCMMAALQCIEDATSLHDLLLRCISLGGDTDTVATIAMGCAWNCKSLENDLPPCLWQELEDGAYGRSFLRKLELQLLNREHLSLRI